jgi:predicted oxidoreductase
MRIEDPDVIVVGAGLAALVATPERVKAGRRVVVLEQANRNSLGGHFFLGGCIFSGRVAGLALAADVA